ncbi:MAG: TonB-dependent receptor [Erythrobacter sp. RIFCSPHIGHO2_12_FULL_63_10]|nr:MAG: TonB-dependent receptor [Erythrobacter sp. RIFCSPHIGHO2_12_FULL_63_10]
MSRLSRILFVTSTSLGALCSATAAQAQDAGSALPAGEESVGEDIVVTGIRASLESARNIKLNSAGIVDAIATEDIGKLPDANLAESLQRITGVSIDRSGGEGAFVTVRGFGPEFNTVLINGRQIATSTDPSQAGGRAFSFDTLASELVSGVEVYKSSTARLQSGGVGSTMAVKTARPFDYSGMRISATVGGNYEENSKELAPDGSFLFSDTFADDTFGILVSAGYQQRKTELRKANTDGFLVNPNVPLAEVNGGAGTVSESNPNGNLFIPQNFDRVVTEESRERIGGTVALQYRPSDDMTFTVDGLYSKFDNDTQVRSFGHWFTASNLTDVTTDENGTAIDMTQATGIATDFHFKTFDKETETWMVGGNLEWQLSDRIKGSFDASFSQAQQFPNNGAQSSLALLGYLTGSVRLQVDDATLPLITETLPTFADPVNRCGSAVTDSGVLADPTVAGLGQPLCQHVMLKRGFGINDKVYQLRSDFTYEGDSDEGLTSLAWGTYFSRDRKRTGLYSNDGGTGCTTCGYNLPVPPEVAISLFNAGGNFLGGVSGADRLVLQWPTFDGAAVFDAITAQQRLTDPNFTFDAPLVNDTVVRERVWGGYVESGFGGTLGGRSFNLVAGVRVERTQAHIDGLATAFTAIIPLANDQTQFGVTTSGTTRTVANNSYTDIMPNLAFRWDFADDMVARFAASQTITRPTLEQMSPVTSLLTLRPGNFAAASGNAELEPFKSSNLDLSFEYYYAPGSYVSLGGYLKEVSNFIVLSQSTGTVANDQGTPLLDPNTGLPAQFAISAPINGENATVTGLEAAWQHSFGDTGFGFQLNGTLVQSNADLDRVDLSNRFALTGLSNSANAVAFYDKNGFEARVAVNWRDSFLQFLAPPPLNGAGQSVTQVKSFTQVDAGTTYHLNDQFAVFVEVANILNQLARKNAFFSNQFLSVEDSGRRYGFGIRYTY